VKTQAETENFQCLYNFHCCRLAVCVIRTRKSNRSILTWSHASKIHENGE